MTPSRRAAGAALAAFAAVALIALEVGSCGSSSLSAPALRRDAGRVCTIARRRTGRITLPSSPNAATAFLTRGLAVLEPERAMLRLLNPPSAAASTYKAALDAFSEELAAMRSTLAEIGGGGDPIAAFRALQTRLDPIEARENDAWRMLGIDACTKR